MALVACFVLSMDASLLNVSIPAIGRDLGGDLFLLKWVVTGKALVFASCMLVGGRIGDVFGPRRTFVTGAVLYGLGGLGAAAASSVAWLIAGESVVKGIGATVMLPATMAALVHIYTGRERAVAFAAWGACAGAGAALGPVVGGVLTTTLSWRWCIGATAALAPGLILAWLWAVPPSPPKPRSRTDVRGAVLVTVAIVLIVAGLSEGSRVGWLVPTGDLVVGSVALWHTHWWVSPIPLVFVAALLVLGTFARLEIGLCRAGREALLDVRHFRRPMFRYGLVSGLAAASGQWGVVFTLPVFFQLGLSLSPLQSGLWLLPAGVATFAFAHVGGWLERSWGPSGVVRAGLAVQAVGTGALGLALGPGSTLVALLPGLLVYGCGFGLVTSQLANTVVSAVPPTQAGVASAATITARQLGVAVGVAVLGSLLSVLATRALLDDLPAAGLPAAQEAALREEIEVDGLDLRSLDGRVEEEPALAEVVEHSVAGAARAPVLLGAGIVGAAALLPAHRRPRGRAGAPIDPSIVP